MLSGWLGEILGVMEARKRYVLTDYVWEQKLLCWSAVWWCLAQWIQNQLMLSKSRSYPRMTQRTAASTGIIAISLNAPDTSHKHTHNNYMS